jgi:hypothetical protein
MLVCDWSRYPLPNCRKRTLTLEQIRFQQVWSEVPSTPARFTVSKLNQEAGL